jgi:hypothetical protein
MDDDDIDFDIRYVAEKTIREWLDENCYDTHDFLNVVKFCEKFVMNYYRAEMEEYARNEAEKNKGRNK